MILIDKIHILTDSQLHQIHKEAAKLFQGSVDIKNPAILGFTLTYLRQGSEEVSWKAAILLKNIAQNKPFVDNNVITAFLAADVLLRENDWYLKEFSSNYLKTIESKSLEDVVKTIDSRMAKLETHLSFNENLKHSLETNKIMLRSLG